MEFKAVVALTPLEVTYFLVLQSNVATHSSIHPITVLATNLGSGGKE
jgi:hypothetical protein